MSPVKAGTHESYVYIYVVSGGRGGGGSSAAGASSHSYSQRSRDLQDFSRHALSFLILSRSRVAQQREMQPFVMERDYCSKGQTIHPPAIAAL